MYYMADAEEIRRLEAERDQARAERDKLAQQIVSEHPDDWTILDALMALDQARAWAKAWKAKAQDLRWTCDEWVRQYTREQAQHHEARAERDAALEALRGIMEHVAPTIYAMTYVDDDAYDALDTARAILEGQGE